MPEKSPTPTLKYVKKITKIYTKPKAKIFLKVFRMLSKKAMKKTKIAITHGLNPSKKPAVITKGNIGKLSNISIDRYFYLRI